MFDVNYLGGHMPTFALNFSRPGSEVIAQYLMLTGLGRDGYTGVMRDAQDVAVQLSSEIAELGPYELLSDGRELPVFAFKLRDDVKNYTVFDVSDQLRQAGWLVPAYSFPENLQDMSVLRIVIRAGMTIEMADLLMEHFRAKTEFLESLTAPDAERGPRGVRPQLIRPAPQAGRPPPRACGASSPRARPGGRGSARRTRRARERP